MAKVGDKVEAEGKIMSADCMTDCVLWPHSSKCMATLQGIAAGYDCIAYPMGHDSIILMSAWDGCRPRPMSRLQGTSEGHTRSHDCMAPRHSRIAQLTTGFA